MPNGMHWTSALWTPTLPDLSYLAMSVVRELRIDGLRGVAGRKLGALWFFSPCRRRKPTELSIVDPAGTWAWWSVLSAAVAVVWRPPAAVAEVRLHAAAEEEVRRHAVAAEEVRPPAAAEEV